MREEQDVEAKVYYFSATFGAAHRVLNLYYDSTLVLLHEVLIHAFQSLDGLVSQRRAQPWMKVRIPEGYFEAMATGLESLALRIEKGQSVHDAILRIAEIGYSVTGNGNYLLERNRIQLQK